MIEQGLQVSLAGLAVTFGALAALVLIMVILVAAFSRPERETQRAKETPAVGSALSDDQEIVAAVAAALTALGPFEARYEGLGACLGAGQGAWWRENAPEQPEAWPAGGRW